jgi:hypothetical protein
MNKKPQRATVRAPTTQPAATIAPSATMGLDGELPLSASNGVTAPAPLAAHDVLQAAMAPREGEPADGTVPPADGVTAESVDGVANAPQPEAEQNTAPAADATQATGKKVGKKAAKAAAQDGAAPAKAPKKERAAAPAKVAKDKFVKCTFSLPESEMLVLDGLKKTHQANGAALKKSQLLRAALLALADVDADRLAQLLAPLPTEPTSSKKKK